MKKKIKWIVFVILMFVMATSLWSICTQDRIDAKTSNHKLKGSGENVGLIEEVGEVAQTFEENQDFCGISFLAGNYDRKNFGTIHLKLYDEENGQLILKKDYDAGIIKNNVMNYFIFDDTVKTKEPHRYKVVITADMKTFFSHFTIWHTKKDNYKEGSLFINDKEQDVDLVFDTVYSYNKLDTSGIKLRRCSLIVFLFVFLGIHCFVNIRRMYQWIFEKRVYIALGIFVFMVVNKYNFSSLAEYDVYIETGKGSQYTEPVFGSSLPIRSDEWMVSLPRLLSAEYSDYGEYNHIVRAEKTTNLSASGLYRSYSALAQPSSWGYYLFGSEIGTSFMWCFNMVFGFFFSYELCLIITKRKPLLALLGGSLIWFSGYNMYWSTVNWLLAGQAALVCFYYFLVQEKRGKKILLGLGTGIFAANFIINLYPAWQVPAGYVYLVILIWMFIENREKIKKYKWVDWGICLLCLGFMMSITVAYFKNNAEYLTDIMNTVYPGARVSYGGFQINQMFGYIACIFETFRTFGNPSELGCFLTLFPIPYIMGLNLFIKKIKSKKSNILLTFLLVVATILGIYCILPLPEILAKVLLLTYSIPGRTVDILGYVMVLLLILVLSEEEETVKMKPVTSGILLGGTLGVALWYTQNYYSESINFIYSFLIAIALFVIFMPLISDFNKKWHERAMISISVIVIIIGLSVNPLMYGLDAIYSKPVAKEIQKIVEQDPDGKWIALNGKSDVSANYLIACGAPTINSVNYIPNMEMWEKLDPTGEKEKVYNRYAHIRIGLTRKKTEMKLKQEDVIQLKLSVTDFEKLDIKYIYTTDKLNDSNNISFKLKYSNDKSYIYEVIY